MIYTKKGDTGKTHLGDKEQVLKSCSRICAIGDLDELSSFLGFFISFMADGDEAILIKKFLNGVQEDLFVISTAISLSKTKLKLEEARVSLIEEKIDELSEKLVPLKNFIVPGGTIRSAICHMARTICRRAERSLVSLSQEEEINPLILIYLNRLSDLLFTISRTLNDNGTLDILISEKSLKKITLD